VETDPLSEVEPDRKRIHMPDVVPLVALRRKEE
jgi:phenylacetic acid degradation protein